MKVNFKLLSTSLLLIPASFVLFNSTACFSLSDIKPIYLDGKDYQTHTQYTDLGRTSKTIKDLVYGGNVTNGGNYALVVAYDNSTSWSSTQEYSFLNTEGAINDDIYGSANSSTGILAINSAYDFNVGIFSYIFDTNYSYSSTWDSTHTKWNDKNVWHTHYTSAGDGWYISTHVTPFEKWSSYDNTRLQSVPEAPSSSTKEQEKWEAGHSTDDYVRQDKKAKEFRSFAAEIQTLYGVTISGDNLFTVLAWANDYSTSTTKYGKFASTQATSYQDLVENKLNKTSGWFTHTQG